MTAVTFTTMRNAAQREVERLDVWQSVLKKEGKPLDAGKAQDKAAFERIVALIDKITSNVTILELLGVKQHGGKR